MKKFLKSLNWRGFFVILLVGIIAGLSNKSIENTFNAFLFGASAGTIMGLIIAIISREEN